jgi:hypothetical protein
MAFKSLLDPSFTYRNAASTDVRLTFDRIRREQRQHLRQRASEATIAVLADAARTTEGEVRGPGPN